MLIIAIATVMITLLAAYAYMRYPLSIGHGINYYTNYLFVYQRHPISGGFIGFEADIMPFMRDSIVWGASPFSFRFVGDFSPNKRGGSTANHIFRDNAHVIYQGEVVWDSDPETLQLFKGYAKDKKHIYMMGFVSKKLDPETFELLGCGFYKDKNGVYNYFKGFENPINEIDKETFKLITQNEVDKEIIELLKTKGIVHEMACFAKDKNHLYISEGGSGFRIIK
jgi:hypothetical protein